MRCGIWQIWVGVNRKSGSNPCPMTVREDSTDQILTCLRDDEGVLIRDTRILFPESSSELLRIGCSPSFRGRIPSLPSHFFVTKYSKTSHLSRRATSGWAETALELGGTQPFGSGSEDASQEGVSGT